MASMLFTDSSPCTAARLLPLSHRHVVVCPRRFVGSLHMGPTYSPISLRSFAVNSSPTPPAASVVPNAALAPEASAKVIDGKSVAKQIRDEITVEVSRMKEAIDVIPGLAVILVGDRKDSATYVRNKKKACESVGINSLEVNLPEDSTEQEVLNYISGFNDDPLVHGILVQLPLPSVCF